MTRIFLSLSLFLSMSVARADSNACAFGEYSDSYLTLVDSEGYGLFRLNERIFLSANRVKSLTAFEKTAIFQEVQDYTQQFGHLEAPKTEKEAVERLAGEDGYISHFSHANNTQDFIVVASYPGDNEYGTIYKVDFAPNGNDQVLTKVANIGDGEIYNCTYTVEDYNN